MMTCLCLFLHVEMKETGTFQVCDSNSNNHPPPIGGPKVPLTAKVHCAAFEGDCG